MAWSNLRSIRCGLLSFMVRMILVSFCSGSVDWIYPSAQMTGMTFNYIDTVYFTWTSDIDGPWMNLWCAPSPSANQSKTYVYHEQVETDGTNPQSFPYSEYDNGGMCHMQVEDFAGDDSEDTPRFIITSNDAMSPQTWGPNITNLPTGASSVTAPGISSRSGISSSSFSSPAPPTSSSASLSPNTVSPMTLTTVLPTSPPTETTIGAAPPPRSAIPSSKRLSAIAKAAIAIGIILSLAMILMLSWIARSWHSMAQRAGGPNELCATVRAELDGNQWQNWMRRKHAELP